MVVPILGSHRCGSSMIAGILKICGLYLGPEDGFIPPGKYNVKGYWEQETIINLNEFILGEFRLEWSGFGSLPDNPKKTFAGKKAIRDIRCLIRGMFKGYPAWGWKDPRTCLTLPLWLEAIKDVDVRPIVIWRDTDHMAVSLARSQDLLLPEMCKKIILRDYAVMIRNLPDLNVLNVNYEKVLENPEREVIAMCAYLGLPNPDVESAIEFVDVSLNHGGK